MCTSPSVDADVIVVGGGPAGSAAAIWCAQHGLRVILLERDDFPRHRPGETLPPGVEPLFAQLGVADAIHGAGFIRHPGTWVSWSGPRRLELFGADDRGAWLGFQASRERLDGMLLAAAARSGAVIRQPSRALHLLRDQDGVAGVTIAEGPLRASWVLDAAGGAHWLARQLSLPLHHASPRLIARYGYVSGECAERDEAPEITADETGWSWSARVAPGRYHWMRLSLVENDPLRDSPPAPLAGLTTEGRTRGADVSWRMVTRLAGPGYICVGDAAAVLDPASSHGVLKAIMSGMMAAHVIIQAHSGRATTLAAAEAYTDWLTEWFHADVNELLRLYRLLPAPPAWVYEDPSFLEPSAPAEASVPGS